MKTLSALLAVAAFATASLPALADSKCTLGKSTYGDVTVVLSGVTLTTHSSLNDAIASLNSVREAGLCEEIPSRCALGKSTFGDITTVVNGITMQNYSNLKDAITNIEDLREAGLCDASVKSNCSLGKSSFGDITVVLNGTTMQTNSNMKDAMAGLKKLSEAGLCGESRPHDFGSCRATQNAEGISLYVNNGATLIDTYRDRFTARAVFQALVKAGACADRR